MDHLGLEVLILHFKEKKEQAISSTGGKLSRIAR